MYYNCSVLFLLKFSSFVFLEQLFQLGFFFC